MKNLYLILLVLNFNFMLAQITKNDSIVISDSNKILNQCEEYSTNSEVILYRALYSTKYLIIFNLDTCFVQYYIDNVDSIRLKRIIDKPNKEYETFFNKKYYNDNLTIEKVRKIEYKFSLGREVYFLYLDKNKIKVAEFISPMDAFPSPIDKNVYIQLLKKCALQGLDESQLSEE